MDTGNTRLKCPTWLPCQRCVLGVRQKRETCLLRVAYIYILPLSVLSIRFDELHAFPSREIVLPLLQSTVSLSLMSKQQTLPPSVFIDSCRGNDTLYFPLSPHHRFDESCCRANGIFLTVRVFEKQVVGPARRESRWIGLDSISSTRKNGEEEKKRRERERRVLRGGAKQFDSHPGPRDFGDAKLPVTAFREKRSCKEKLRRERIKKGRSWLPSPSASEPYFLFSPSLERARHLFFGQVKLSFISTGRNEAPQKGEETTVAR